LKNIKENDTGTIQQKSPKKRIIISKEEEVTEPQPNEDVTSTKISSTPSESESESSQRSSTGKDFEIVDADDVETS